MYAVHFFVLRRAQVTELLKTSQNGLELAHCVRLIALAMIDIILTLPMAVMSWVDSIQNRVVWDSWENVHAQWSRVVVFTDLQILPHSRLSIFLFLPRWILPLLSISAFLLIGSSEDSIRQYRQWWACVNRLSPFLGKQKPQMFNPSTRLELGSTVVRAVDRAESSNDEGEGVRRISEGNSLPGGVDAVQVNIKVRYETV